MDERLERLGEIIKQLQKYKDQAEADGCSGCYFEEFNAFMFPCKACKRNYMDRWTRRKENVE